MIYLASDHAGFDLKKEIIAFLTMSKLDYEDIGAFVYDEKDDYPDFIIPAAEKVAVDPENNLGIVIGGSGQGEAIAANKVRNIRAALYYGGPIDIVTLSRVHNHANVLSLGARFVSKEEAIKVITIWLNTSYVNRDRHSRRIEKIQRYERRD